jgi:phospho-N-acetylmuramoyl-pentapeptide-transferase
MGGVAIIAAAVVGYLAAHVEGTFTTRGLAGVLAVCGAALVGFADDWIKVTRQRSLGLNKRAKFAGQLAVALGFAVVCVVWLKVDTHLSFTRYNSLGVQLGHVGWVVLAVLVILGTTNAVNLTDGLDGLAAGSSTFTFAAFTVIGFYQLRHFDIYRNPAALDEAVLAASMIGACAGFLWWNAAPARIFMGDTGSLGIGAAVAVLALLENVDLLLPIVGGLFVVETISVIVQVASFRLAHRRVFRMAPIHHHFELLGWPETTVIVRFWILAGLFTALALGVFYADFLAKGGTG